MQPENHAPNDVSQCDDFWTEPPSTPGRVAKKLLAERDLAIGPCSTASMPRAPLLVSPRSAAIAPCSRRRGFVAIIDALTPSIRGGLRGKLGSGAMRNVQGL